MPRLKLINLENNFCIKVSFFLNDKKIPKNTIRVTNKPKKIKFFYLFFFCKLESILTIS